MSSSPRRYKPRPDKHTVLSGKEADDNCPTIGGFTGINCEDCGGRYIIHCLKCNLQVSNCGCTIDKLMARHAEEKLVQADKEEWEKKEGVWTPPSRIREP